MARHEPVDEVEAMAGECLAVRVRTLNRAITAIYDDALRPLGLRVGQLNLLVVIARLGQARAGDLCRVLRMDKSTLSRDLEVLKRNGWVEPVDAYTGRGQPLRIAPQARELLKAAGPAWRTAQEKAKALLGDDGSASITRVVNDLWAAKKEQA